VRGGGERGSGRSSGAGAFMVLDFFFFVGYRDEAVADSDSSCSVNVAMSNVMGCALTNSEEVEPGGGSENGSIVLWA
jgi:hypothetical protein